MAFDLRRASAGTEQHRAVVPKVMLAMEPFTGSWHRECGDHSSVGSDDGTFQDQPWQPVQTTQG